MKCPMSYMYRCTCPENPSAQRERDKFCKHAGCSGGRVLFCCLVPFFAPAVAPISSRKQLTESDPEVPMIGSSAPIARPERNSTDLPRPRPISGAVTLAPKPTRVVVIHALPALKQTVVRPLNPLTLPTVSIKFEPARQTRDRKALFPEVIDN